MQTLITQTIVERIYVIRGIKVMLDYDLAMLYGTETKVLKQSIRRNIKRFPPDFMFELTKEEFEVLRSQIVTSKTETEEQRGGTRYMPFAFTEQGVAMLSSVLKSDSAIEVNIVIMRAFVQLRGILASHQELALRMDALEERYDGQFHRVFEAIKQLMSDDGIAPPKPPIGFIP
jgi:hypothetical protein